MLYRYIIVLILFSFPIDLSAQSQWAGFVEHGLEGLFFTANIDDDSVEIQFPYEHDFNRNYQGNITKGTSDTSLVFHRFEQKFQLKVKGLGKRHHIIGKAVIDGFSTNYVMLETIKLDSASLAAYTGAYAVNDTTIYHVRNQGNLLLIYSPRFRNYRRAYPTSTDNLFITAHGYVISIEDDTLTIGGTDGPISAAKFNPYRKEEVSYMSSDSLQIYGSLYLPSRVEKHSATLFLGGGGNADREHLLFDAEFYAIHGIAALAIDKRGTGKTGGELWNATFQRLAEDAKEGITYLQNRNEIDPNKVGVRGVSQGGRLVFMTASNNPDVAFILNGAGPMMTLRDNQLYAIAQYSRQTGVPEELISEIVSIWKDYYDQGPNGTISDSLVSDIRSLRKKRENLFLPPDTTVVAAGFDNPEISMSDPYEYARKVNCPVFSFYGEFDMRVSRMESMRRIREAMEEAENNSFVFRIYPGADHSFRAAHLKTSTGVEYDQVKWIWSKVGQPGAIISN